jgi:transposase
VPSVACHRAGAPDGYVNRIPYSVSHSRPRNGPDRRVRLLVDHREDLLAERTRAVNRLRWHLHELDPEWDPPSRSLDRASALNRITHRLADMSGTVARLAAAIIERCRQLTTEIDALEAEIRTLTERLAPALIAIPGCASLTAAKLLGQTAGVLRFRSAAAYARHNGTAPLPVWSSNRPRHRLSRTGNRHLNAALHRIAMTQTRCHPPARELIARRKASGDGGLEAPRILKEEQCTVPVRARSDIEIIGGPVERVVVPALVPCRPGRAGSARAAGRPGAAARSAGSRLQRAGARRLRCSRRA